MTWKDTVQEYLGREQEYQTDERTKTVFNRGDNNMTNPQKRVIRQRSKSIDEIEVQKLLGKTVSENCNVCRRSLLDDSDRSELFHITATESGRLNDDGVNTKSFCEHSVDSRAATQAKSTSRDLCSLLSQRSQCAPSHAIDVEVMVKSSGSTPRDAYVYYEIDTVFMHDSEVEGL